MCQALFLAALLAGGDPAPPDFTGKSLTGWDMSPGHWSAENGIIVGRSDGSIKVNTFLCSRAKFRDFEMTFQVRLKDGKGNSGVQFRSEVFDPAQWRVKGPQADIADKYWGILYGENFGGIMQQSDFEKVKTKLKPTDFNDYYLRSEGKKVTIRVNGVTTVDAELKTIPDEGIIALQLHQGPPMEVTFRNISFRTLR